MTCFTIPAIPNCLAERDGFGGTRLRNNWAPLTRHTVGTAGIDILAREFIRTNVENPAPGLFLVADDLER